MHKLTQIFREAFYSPEPEKNCVLEFTYPQLKQIDIDEMTKKLTALLKGIDVPYSNNYRNISKVMIICKPDKIEDVKSIAKSLGLSLQKELVPDNTKETNHL
jgi:hypothetical protein